MELKIELIKSPPILAQRLMMGVVLFLLAVVSSYAQSTVTGKIMDESGEPLIGASVVVEGTSQGTISDFDGGFEISVSDLSNTVLLFSYTGYEDQRIALNGLSNLTVTLKEGATLDEVVVVGYASRKKTEVTGAISTLKSDNFNIGVISSPEQLLQAKIPGVRITSNGGEPGGAVNVTIRGAGSLRSGNCLLYTSPSPRDS